MLTVDMLRLAHVRAKMLGQDRRASAIEVYTKLLAEQPQHHSWIREWVAKVLDDMDREAARDG